MITKLQRAFSSLLVSYLITMAFTISIGCLTYYEALKVVEKDSAEANLSILKQGSELIDARLNEVENLVNQLSFHPMITSFLNSTDREVDADQYKAIDTWKYIQSYRFSNDFMFNFYVSFANSHIIMSPKDISFRLPMYYEASIHYGGMSYEQWNAEFMEKAHNGEYMPAHPVSINGKVNSYVTYIQTVPLGARSNLKGAVFVLIPETEIQRLLNRVDLQEGGWLVVSDASGKVITSMAEDNRSVDLAGLKLNGTEGLTSRKLNGEDMQIYFYESPEHHWKYVTAIPLRVVMKKADNIRKTNAFIISIGLLIGCLIAIFFAYRNSKPVRALIRTFGERLSANGTVVNEYRMLEHSISRMIHNNDALQSEIEKQMPLLRAALLDRLFRGDFMDTCEAESALSDVGMSLAGDRFMVIVLRLNRLEILQDRDHADSLNVKRVIIKELLISELGESGFIHDLQQDKMAVLYCFQQDTGEQCIDLAEGIVARWNELLNKQSACRIVFGLGGLYERLPDVYRSFKEALKALELIDFGSGECMLRYDQIPQHGTDYYYPLEIEQRIMNLVKSGNEEETRRLLTDIYQKMTASRTSFADALNLLIFDLTATVYKLINEVAQTSDKEVQMYRESLGRVGSFATFQEAYAHLSETFVRLCRHAGSQKKSHNVELKDKIIGYIHDHYTDGNLKLAHIADHFGMSEVYLSQFFREQAGNNFSKYLEELRMKHARELLMQPELTIEDIARGVGYINTNTFYKAFKRIEGISPGAFRSGLHGR